MPHPLNLIYLHSHDTGRYVQPYGYTVSTPNLQRFAEQGVLFRQAFCASPTCSPSRAALLTGRHPHQVGMFGLAHRGWTLDDYGATLISALNHAGYYTVLNGIQHAAQEPDGAATLGYQETLESETCDERADAACAFLKRRHDQPFFLDVGFLETHRTPRKVFNSGNGIAWHNGAASPAGGARYVRPPVTMPDTPEARADFADFAYAAGRLDAAYGRILRTLDATGLAGRTIVLVTTDHGIAFPRMKCNLTDHGLGVLLILRGPRELGLDGGRVIDAMVSHLDVLPTLNDLLGLGYEGSVEGTSWRPLLDRSIGPADSAGLHDALFAGVSYHGQEEVERAIRTSRYKYIRRYGPPFKRHSSDGSVSAQLLVRLGWGEPPAPEEQLFDLAFDTGEANNLADRPGHESLVAELRDRLEAWMQRTSDPALHGSVPRATDLAARPIV